MERIEQRMYGFVNYQLTGIQKGIQFSHALTEYSFNNFHSMNYLDWAKYYKTVILLNGGTTNNNPEKLGKINQIHMTLMENGVVCSTFCEEDLGDQMTSICFLVDERVYNRKKYLDLGDWVVENYGDLIREDHRIGFNLNKLERDIKNSEIPSEKKIYAKWIDYIGGETNAFLREYLPKFELA